MNRTPNMRGHHFRPGSIDSKHSQREIERRYAPTNKKRPEEIFISSEEKNTVLLYTPSKTIEQAIERNKKAMEKIKLTVQFGTLSQNNIFTPSKQKEYIQIKLGVSSVSFEQFKRYQEFIENIKHILNISSSKKKSSRVSSHYIVD
ncbi:MAG: hypothetical protein QM526_00335 [Alphaproteobacteria bacterium]|nr:hypothetical protein [Alphaproteobacteria bacterium]